MVHGYTPKSTKTWEAEIVNQVKQELAWIAAAYPQEFALLPVTGRVLMDVRFNVVKPKSAPKSIEFPLKANTGDIDNLAKSVLDALQIAGVLADDKTVTDLITSKRFAEENHPEGVEFSLVAWLEPSN